MEAIHMFPTQEILLLCQGSKYQFTASSGLRDRNEATVFVSKLLSNWSRHHGVIDNSLEFRAIF